MAGFRAAAAAGGSIRAEGFALDHVSRRALRVTTRESSTRLRDASATSHAVRHDATTIVPSKSPEDAMLVAPFSPLPPSGGHSLSRSSRRNARDQLASALASAWLIAGAAALLLVPFARGDGRLGATLPFWLVGAPLIDLAWIHRRRIAVRASASLRAVTGRARPLRNVRDQCFARARSACSAARS